jgi:hypothetical protein
MGRTAQSAGAESGYDLLQNTPATDRAAKAGKLDP